MCSHDENTETVDYTIRNISTDEQQIVISFQSNNSCNEDQNHSNYKGIVGNILRGRDVIIVTKQDQLKDLISDSVDASDQSYVTNNATGVVSFTPYPESSVKHHATLLKEMPISVAEDLATSTEFVYGNLWFLIPPNQIFTSRCKEDVINDVHKLTSSAFSEAPVLQHEAVASPAMYDGLQILWFKANQNILFEQFAFKI
ncbi:hypothetical protein EVAR_60653_1 [Eumeta japonica]|uniref:Uncharacterized protein n=1 Tax=Eumeta variegata TaxID=151549 RepID=A0A4C1ZQ20_EUMVA|nr:hypothetical protein EVAR_60653_1 [Eumeta japonica]